jgi:hypothetical protein
MSTPHFREIRLDPPYDLLLKGVLAFRSFPETEACIARLEEYRQRFLAASDKKGVGYCRKLGILGRRRAGMMARNPRVSSKQRLLKHEVALWFQVWLETPELFSDWLALRKQAGDFLRLKDSESDQAQPIL